MSENTAPIVVKLGGALLADEDALQTFWPALKALRAKAPVVLVHGGGQQATAMARRLGHEPRIVEGRRVTSDLDLKISQWALRGRLNTQLVAQAARHDLPATGLSGADGGLLKVTRRPPWEIDGEEVDFGWVGDVERVDAGVLDGLLQGGFLPIVAPLGLDAEGQVYNVNADTVAKALAEALQASELLLVTQAGHLRRSAQKEASRVPCCNAALFEDGKTEGWIQGGMRVKLDVAFEALRAGTSEVFILAPDDVAARARATRVVL